MPDGGERVPVRAVGELVGAMRRVRSRLRDIHAPALVIHSQDDPLVPASSALRVSRELAGPVELVVREGPTHAVTAGEEREAIAELTLRFLAARAPLAPATPAGDPR
jgi:carboxylesterase